MSAYYEQGDMTIIQGDSIEVMAAMPANSVDLILTDPPYFRVKNEQWDRQWDTATGFLAWLDTCAEQWHRVLKSNGSLYVFASPRMAARVECMVSERFCVLNRIRWVKEAGWHNKAKKESLRSFLSPWEEVIFAEHYGADNIAKGEAGYAAKCDELRGFLFEPLRAYLDGERIRAGVAKEDCNVACGFSRSPGGMASRHYFSRSQWQLPTEKHYAAMQELFNASGGDYLRREYDDLRREYDDLRREYDDLRREYDDLRRPFAVTPNVPYTDVWSFPTVQAYQGKHPCEKPTALLRHIITASTRPGAIVLDSFAGSGATGVACQETGRGFVGIELEERYCEIAANRLRQSVMLLEVAS
jgi:site-specific DNA-methyltransferase (adenine-specific)